MEQNFEHKTRKYELEIAFIFVPMFVMGVVGDVATHFYPNEVHPVIQVLAMFATVFGLVGVVYIGFLNEAAARR